MEELLKYLDLGWRGVIAVLLAMLWLKMRDVKEDVASLRSDFVSSLISTPHHRSTKKEHV